MILNEWEGRKKRKEERNDMSAENKRGPSGAGTKRLTITLGVFFLSFFQSYRWSSTFVGNTMDIARHKFDWVGQDTSAIEMIFENNRRYKGR